DANDDAAAWDRALRNGALVGRDDFGGCESARVAGSAEAADGCGCASTAGETVAGVSDGVAGSLDDATAGAFAGSFGAAAGAALAGAGSLDEVVSVRAIGSALRDSGWRSAESASRIRSATGCDGSPTNDGAASAQAATIAEASALARHRG